MRKLTDLSEKEYTTLKKMGFLYEFFPEATGDWKADCNSGISVPNLSQVCGWLCSHLVHNTSHCQAEGRQNGCRGCFVDTNENFIRWFKNASNQSI